eukprot:jgi/Tetstr1/423936/TSEL_001418.t1
MEAWDREYSSVKYSERGDSEKRGFGRLVRGYVFLTMRAMELLFRLHNVRQPNGAVTTELVLIFTTTNASVTSDPPSSCRPKISSAHPVDTSPVAVPDDEDPIQQAKVTRYRHTPPWACDQREYVQYKFQQSVLEDPEIYMDKL